MPESPGVYLFKKNNRPIYVGKAVNLKRRITSYFDLDLEPKTSRMIKEADSVGIIRVNSELESLLLEAKLIRKHMPHYNIAAKDDKHPLYIRITKEEFPRVITARKISSREPNLAFFGPFPSSNNVRSVLRMIRRIFPYSDHKLGKRPCLYSQIGLCNPCPNSISRSRQSDLKRKYLGSIRRIKAVLSGKFNSVRENLQKEMDNFSENLKYEEALELREQIKKLDYITQPQMPVDFYMENPNLLNDIREKELSQLQKILKLYNLDLKSLNRIECFDIAHFAGDSPTASMVVFIDGEADKTFYRHFRIRRQKGDSDTDSLREVIKRRLNHLKDWGKPDLIIVDGGKPQTSTFVRELESYNVPVVGLAKRFETLVIPIRRDGTLNLKEHKVQRGSALNLVQRIRDEAHRFARAYHHKLVSKSLLTK